MNPCPKCGCPFISRSVFHTADGHSAWKDTDGKWYKGPAHEQITERCDGCGRTEVIKRERGKEVSRVVE